MGQGTVLTTEEKTSITSNCADGLSIAKIAIGLKRPWNVIKNFLHLKNEYGTNHGKKPGRVFCRKQSTLSKRMINLICNDQVVKRKTIQEIKDSHHTLSIQPQ